MGNQPDDPTRRDSTVHPLHIVNRRRFIAGSGAAIASAGVVGVSAFAQDGATPVATPIGGTPVATPVGAGGTTTAELEAANTPVSFFTVHEAQTVDALVSRILPGTADDPGAHEAGVVVFIDRVLHGTNLGYDLKTYTQGPFLGIAEEPVSVEASTTTDIYTMATVTARDISRYGFQSIMGPQEMYRRGLTFVDAAARNRFQANFIDLTTDQQDQILTAMDDDSAAEFDGPSGKAFFAQLRNDTIEGMFSDPMYGGNQNMAGWKLIGYPGAQAAYAPGELQTPGTDRQPQSLMEMIAMGQH